MIIIRETFHCKPGKVRPMVEKLLAMSRLNEKLKMPKMRIMTDLTGERYWTVVAEMEMPSLKAFEEMMAGPPAGQTDDVAKQFEQIMKDYHDLVIEGRREIYKVEG
jgi:hypothetical protein